MRYEATFRNLTFEQAKAMYGLAVNLSDPAQMFGHEGEVWSGLIPGDNLGLGQRTITIQPMVGEVQEASRIKALFRSDESIPGHNESRSERSAADVLRH